MNSRSLIALGPVLGACLTDISIAAAVVGHRRFEDAPGFLAESSGSGFAPVSAAGHATTSDKV